MVNTIAGRLGTVLIGIALARILGPAEFGAYAVALVALIAVLSFNELGVSLAIVRWRADPAIIAPTVATISVGASALLTAVVWIAAPAFTDAMGAPAATGVVRTLGFCILVNGLVAVPAAMLERTFRQDQRLVTDQVNVWVGAIVSIALAVMGVGAMSLAVGRLAGALTSAALFLRYCPLPLRLGFDPQQARSLFSFGLPLAGASVIVFLVGFVDQLVVGRFLGAEQLGAYTLAVNLASWPSTVISQPLRNVAPAMFARLQENPERMSQDFQLVLRPLGVVTLPMCAILAAAAPAVVGFVYGPAWAAATGPLRWLALAAAGRILAELAYDYLVVLARSRQVFIMQAVMVVVLTATAIVAVREWGASGVGEAVAATACLVGVPLYMRELQRVGVSAAGFVRGLVPGLLGAAVISAAAVTMIWLVASDIVDLFACGVLFVGVTGALVWRTRASLRVFRASSSSTARVSAAA